MKRYDFWKLSLLNIFAAPARSVLTVLGMAIGIGAILAVITLGDAGRAQVKSEMTRLGIDRVWLTAAEGPPPPPPPYPPPPPNPLFRRVGGARFCLYGSTRRPRRARAAARKAACWWGVPANTWT